MKNTLNQVKSNLKSYLVGLEYELDSLEHLQMAVGTILAALGEGDFEFLPLFLRYAGDSHGRGVEFFKSAGMFHDWYRLSYPTSLKNPEEAYVKGNAMLMSLCVKIVRAHSMNSSGLMLECLVEANQFSGMSTLQQFAEVLSELPTGPAQIRG